MLTKDELALTERFCISQPETGARVLVVMGSQSDMPLMQYACLKLAEFNVSFGKRIWSAHRTPDRLRKGAMAAAGEGVQCIIAGAGGAAHLPGMVKAYTRLPVFGVPVPLEYHDGLDSTLSIQQMPKGKPVSTMAVGKPGAINAALSAIEVLALMDPRLAQVLEVDRENITRSVEEEPEYVTA